MPPIRTQSQPAPAVPAPDHRAEPRFLCRGQIEIALESPDNRRLNAELADISRHGFRIVYHGELLSSGTVFTFRHLHLEGRARLMWGRHTTRFNEGGCLVMRP